MPETHIIYVLVFAKRIPWVSTSLKENMCHFGIAPSTQFLSFNSKTSSYVERCITAAVMLVYLGSMCDKEANHILAAFGHRMMQQGLVISPAIITQYFVTMMFEDNSG
ncbi:unnamed protein product [Clonostachys rhizophaga]|uniref:Uncharacterized protein n=1 Tax=Clonostachys rhizophaga TaxID=160324 RepID=A0A9N9VJ25_9HYPO|nr:unnamed protein product [Clonostachys rhizophaga]